MTNPSDTIDPGERARVAAELAPGRRDRRLLDVVQRPTWSADGRWLWYRTPTREGVEHRLVDIDGRRKTTLVDRAALAEALVRATGGDVDARALPLARVDFDPATRLVRFEACGGAWQWDDDARALERLRAAFAPHEMPSPDERHAVFVDAGNLRVRRAGEAASRALTDDGSEDFGWGSFFDYILQVTTKLAGETQRPQALWSPDSTRLAVVRTDLREVGVQHLVQSLPPAGIRPVLHSYRFPLVPDRERERVEIWFVSLDGKRVRARLDDLESYSHRPFGFGLGRWSKDGRSFYVFDSDRAATRVVVWRVDPEDGRAEQVLVERGEGIVRAGPTIGSTPIFEPLANGRAIGWSQRSGWGHLQLIDANGEATPITRGDFQVRDLLFVDEAKEELLFSAGGREPGIDPYALLVYKVRFDGTGLRLLTPALEHHELVAPPHPGNGDLPNLRSVSPTGAHFVDSFSSPVAPPRSLVRDTDGESTVELERADASDVWPAPLPLPEPFHVTPKGGGLELWGVLYKPLGFDPSRRYPVVEVIYAGPQTIVAPKGWSPEAHGAQAEQLAAMGFVVMIIDGPGTPYRSHAFQLRMHGKLELAADLAEHVHALGALASTRPWMDLARVGIVGGSGGGFASFRALVEFPETYKACVSLCGAHDSRFVVPIWGEVFQGLYDEALYDRQDNTRLAERLRGKLLLLQGELDENVHVSILMRLVDALIRADKDFEMLIVPNMGHMLYESPYAVRRAHDFLIRHLGVGEPQRATSTPAEEMQR